MEKIKIYLNSLGVDPVLKAIAFNQEPWISVPAHKNAFLLVRSICIGLLLAQVRKLRITAIHAGSNRISDALDFEKVEITLPEALAKNDWRKKVIDNFSRKSPFKEWPSELWEGGRAGKLLTAGRAKNGTANVLKMTGVWSRFGIGFYANSTNTASDIGLLTEEIEILKYVQILIRNSPLEQRDAEHFLNNEYPYVTDSKIKHETFEEWLLKIARSGNFSRVRVVENHPSVDDCILLDSARSREGYRHMELKSEGNLTCFPQIKKQHVDKWIELRSKQLRQGDGRSAMLTSFCPESAYNGSRLTYCMIGHDCGPAFTKLLDEPSNIAEYEKGALRVLSYTATRRLSLHPQVLSTGIILIFGSKNPKILIGNRASRDHYVGDVWGVSIATHFKPEVEILSDNQQSIPDHSILESVERGLRLELLGNDFDFRSHGAKIGVHGLAMNGKLFYFFIAIAHFPLMSFEEILRLQASSKTPERKQNTVLAELDFGRDPLSSIIFTDERSDNPVERLKAKGLVRLDPSFGHLPIEAWKWQRGSGLRLAIAHKYLQDFKANDCSHGTHL